MSELEQLREKIQQYRGNATGINSISMKKNELHILLINSNVPEDSYYLEGGLPNEAFCLNKEDDDIWEVYYSERGVKSQLKKFESEEDACENFYLRIKWSLE